jgi:hypothetical protein
MPSEEAAFKNIGSGTSRYLTRRPSALPIASAISGGESKRGPVGR